VAATALATVNKRRFAPGAAIQRTGIIRRRPEPRVARIQGLIRASSRRVFVELRVGGRLLLQQAPDVGLTK
jgi:hypothetical protein